jgi:alpha-L-arabinofuranosidase
MAFMLPLCVGCTTILAQTGGNNQISVDLSRTSHKIPASMYGIFFEEINHSGDGGLYAELIQNRGFEDKTLPGGTSFDNNFAVAPASPNYRNNQTRNFRLPWSMQNLWPGWSLKQQGTAAATIGLTTDKPLNKATPNSMQLTIAKASNTEQVELANEGYWGIALKAGEKYNVRFFVRTGDNYKGNVTAKLVLPDGKVVAEKAIVLKKAGVWNEYTVQLTSSATEAKASFVLGFNTPGTVWVDHLSLFPDKTFKNRKNGLRTDVAQLLADLKPAFMRWPGGCIVEGLTLENRVQWKQTIGDPVTRPGQYDLWGYRNSYGFGYHEFLQFIEDIGAQGMYVANIGVSCSVRNGDYCSPMEVAGFIQDALDAIEYAIGDVKTTWGAKRAAAGHPAPFPLQYVEVGNEDAGPDIYNERFNLFQKAISAKYPQITIISNHGLNDNMSSIGKTDMIDPHYYVSPDWFYARANNLFDNVQPRPPYKAYVGEYAVNRNVGTGNMNGALSEAAFLIGAERNSDFVTMTSYAPLIENSNKRDWQVNMIWVKSDQSMGRSSYYIQKLFAENRPDINLVTKLQHDMSSQPKEPFSGFMGLLTNRAKIEIKDFIVTSNGTAAAIDPGEWKPVDGQWVTGAGTYSQTDTAGRHSSFLKSRSIGSGTITFKAMKAKRTDLPTPTGGGNNFGRFGNNYAFVFGAKDDKNYYQLTFNARGVNLEKVVNGTAQYVTEPARLSLEDDRTYDVKINTSNNGVEVFIDGKSVLAYTFTPDIKHYAIAGMDEQKNEIVIKVVNGEAEPYKTTLQLVGSSAVGQQATVSTLSSTQATDENTFEKPRLIAPQTATVGGISKNFEYTFKPYSLTVLRIKKM